MSMDRETIFDKMDRILIKNSALTNSQLLQLHERLCSLTEETWERAMVTVCKLNYLLDFLRESQTISDEECIKLLQLSADITAEKILDSCKEDAE